MSTVVTDTLDMDLCSQVRLGITSRLDQGNVPVEALRNAVTTRQAVVLILTYPMPLDTTAERQAGR